MMLSQDPINTIENLMDKNKTRSVSLYLVLLLVVIVVLFLLPVVKIVISSQSRGMVRSNTDKVPVQVLVNGKIIACNLKNNKVVHKGDTLLQVAQDNLQTEKTTTQIAVNDTQNLINDLEQASKGNSSNLQTEVITQEWYSYISRRSELQEKANYAQQDYERYKKLYDKGVIASIEFEKYKHAYASAQHAIQVLEKSQKTQWQNRRRELLGNFKNLSGTINKINLESKNYYIIAPVSGVVENYSGLQVGSFLNASQPIAVITPVDNLIVECTISPDDVGLLREKQKVKFQFDAFDYNQWGLLEGRVIDIDKNITLHENQAFFKVRCSLNSKMVQLKSGYKAQISNGMTLTARYVITRRSLFDLLFDKVDDWLNPNVVSVY